MKLILVRHTEAFALGENGIQNDFDRTLTENGQKQAHRLAETLAKLGVLPHRIFTSPYIRAIQTAEPIAKLLTPQIEPTIENFLRLEELKPKKLTKSLSSRDTDTVILVGHMPDLATYAGWLLGAGTDSIQFDKGAAAMIAFGKKIEKGYGELRWLITPDWYLENQS